MTATRSWKRCYARLAALTHYLVEDAAGVASDVGYMIRRRVRSLGKRNHPETNRRRHVR
jgi:hypothetical protein